MEREHLAFVLVTAVVAIGFFLSGGDPNILDRVGEGAGPGVGEPDSEHLHAYMVFYVNGSERSLGEEYFERDSRAHFHGSDGIIHVHAKKVDVGYVLGTLDIQVNSTCLEFGVENESFCSSGAVGVKVNGEEKDLGSALDYRIEQGDSIVLWYGQEPPDYERRLPPEYREQVPGKSV